MLDIHAIPLYKTRHCLVQDILVLSRQEMPQVRCPTAHKSKNVAPWEVRTQADPNISTIHMQVRTQADPNIRLYTSQNTR
jgi:hypothetical protein